MKTIGIKLMSTKKKLNKANKRSISDFFDKIQSNFKYDGNEDLTCNKMSVQLKESLNVYTSEIDVIDFESQIEFDGDIIEQFFLIKKGRSLYLVNTEGFSYTRYITKVK